MTSREARTDDGSAEDGADSVPAHGGTAGVTGRDAHDNAVGHDGAASFPLGWAVPALRAPAYVDDRPRNAVTGFHEKALAGSIIDQPAPLTDEDAPPRNEAGIHPSRPAGHPSRSCEQPSDPGRRQWAAPHPFSPLNAERAAVLLKYASGLVDRGCPPAVYADAIRALPDYHYALRDREDDLRFWGYPREEQGMATGRGDTYPGEGIDPREGGGPRGRDLAGHLAGPGLAAEPGEPGHPYLPDSPDHLEVPLLGGDMTDGVVRVGRTVRRPVQPHTPAVHALLRHLEAVGFDGAPRVLGIDPQNREVLTYLPGEVPYRPLPPYALSEATLVRLAELLLRYHQAVVGFEPPSWARWDGEVTPLVDGPPELVCHCDLNLENVIFRPGPDGPEPYALIDFDLARPGTRLVDIIQTLRYWAPLTAPADRDPAFADVDVPARIALFCQAYGLSYAERARLVPVAVRWMRRSRGTIAARARRYGGAWSRALDAGVGERLVRSAVWLQATRPEIDAQLRRHRLPGPAAGRDLA